MEDNDEGFDSDGFASIDENEGAEDFGDGEEEAWGGDDDFGAEDPDLEGQMEILDSKTVQKMMDTVVDNMAGIVNIPKPVCVKLLQTLRWNEEKLTTQFFEGRKELLQKHGLESPFLTPKTIDKSSIVCQICFDEVELQKAFSLGCNHWFCNSCWKLYLTDKVKTAGTRCILSTCPAFKCNTIVPDNAFARFLEKGLVEKYRHASLNAFVTQKRELRWCPGTRCDRVIKAGAAVTTVKCICGQSFCFKCSEEAHNPVTCDQVSQWQAKCDKESETAQWIISNTRKCPKCLVRIEKNQGCNHMTCQFCKHEFCWVCMGPWSDHGNHTGGFYKCNKYNPHLQKNKDESKAELDRFLHYYQRYHNHDQARKFAKKQIEIAEKRMADLYAKGEETPQWQSVQFLRKSTVQVLECRRVLKYTYVYGYYCHDAKERELFEFLQEDLEKATEKLSELSEQPLESLQRQEVVDFTMFTQKFTDNLLRGLVNGLTKVRGE